MVGAVVATPAAKDDDAVAVGTVVSQECAFVVEKVVARVYAEDERGAAVYKEEALNE